MRARSSRSVIRRRSRPDSALRTSAASLGSTAPSCSSSAYPSIAVSGVLSSWPTDIRKSRSVSCAFFSLRAMRLNDCAMTDSSCGALVGIAIGVPPSARTTLACATCCTGLTMRRLRYHAATAANGESRARREEQLEEVAGELPVPRRRVVHVDHGARMRTCARRRSASPSPKTRPCPTSQPLCLSRAMAAAGRSPPVLRPVQKDRAAAGAVVVAGGVQERLAKRLVGVAGRSMRSSLDADAVQLRDALLGRRTGPRAAAAGPRSRCTSRKSTSSVTRTVRKSVVRSGGCSGTSSLQPVTEAAQEAADADERRARRSRSPRDGQDEDGDEDHRDTTL